MSSAFLDSPLFSVRYPPSPSRPSACLVFFKLSLLSPSASSSSNAIRTGPETTKEKRQRRHEAFEQFLLQKCGFSHSQLTAILGKEPSLFRSKSTQKAEEAVELFIDSGFTPPQLRKTILDIPHILTLKVDGHMKNKMDFFKGTLGLDQELGRVLSQHPRILTCSLEGNLCPKIPSLVKLFGSNAKVSKAVRRIPLLLLYSSETLEKKFKTMESLGLKEHEIKKVLDKDPRFLVMSVEKLNKNMDFLTRTVGFRPNIVVKYPKFLNYGVEKRLRPRYKVFEYLTSVLGSEGLNMPLPIMLNITDQAFALRVLMGRPQLAKLFNQYRGESEDLELI